MASSQRDYEERAKTAAAQIKPSRGLFDVIEGEHGVEHMGDLSKNTAGDMDEDFVFVESPEGSEPSRTEVKAPRFFALPADHALVYDPVGGVPTLHIRPRSEQCATIITGGGGPNAAEGAPFLHEYNGSDGTPKKMQMLFWARPGEEGFVPVLRKSLRANLNIKAAVLGFAVRWVRAGGEPAAPESFVFSPDMVVTYWRPEDQTSGVVLITRRSDMELFLPPVISPLTPRTIIF